MTGFLDHHGDGTEPGRGRRGRRPPSRRRSITYLERLEDDADRPPAAGGRAADPEPRAARRSDPALIARSERRSLSSRSIGRRRSPLTSFQPPTAVRGRRPDRGPGVGAAFKVPKSLPLADRCWPPSSDSSPAIVLALVLERFDTRIRSRTRGGGRVRSAGAGRGAGDLAGTTGNDGDGRPTRRRVQRTRSACPVGVRWTTNGDGTDRTVPRGAERSSSPVPRRATARPPSPRTWRSPTRRRAAGCLVVSCDLRRPAIHEVVRRRRASRASPTCCCAPTNGDADPTQRSTWRRTSSPVPSCGSPCSRAAWHRSVRASCSVPPQMQTVPGAAEEDHRRHHPGLRAAGRGERRGAAPSAGGRSRARGARGQDPAGARGEHRRAAGAHGRSARPASC